MTDKLEENKPSLLPKNSKILKRHSFNTSFSSNDSMNISKRNFLFENKLSNNLFKNDKPQFISNYTSRNKVCEGERLSFEVMRNDSKQKNLQFMHRYANDPFMRKKFEKSVQRFNSSRSSQLINKHQDHQELKRNVKLTNNSFTTLREKMKQESQKTFKLINNCRQLVEELKKNRLNTEENQDRSLFIPSQFKPKKYIPGALTDRV